MKKIVFISCGKTKLPHKARAEDLYTGQLFTLSLAFARSLQPDKIFILSAKHGLVELDQKLEPYEQTLNTMPAHQVKEWAAHVREQMKGKGIDFDNDEAIFLAGEKYRKYLLPHFQRSNVPLRGLSFGRQLQYLKKKINDEE